MAILYYPDACLVSADTAHAYNQGHPALAGVVAVACHPPKVMTQDKIGYIITEPGLKHLGQSLNNCLHYKLSGDFTYFCDASGEPLTWKGDAPIFSVLNPFIPQGVMLIRGSYYVDLHQWGSDWLASWSDGQSIFLLSAWDYTSYNLRIYTPRDTHCEVRNAVVYYPGADRPSGGTRVLTEELWNFIRIPQIQTFLANECRRLGSSSYISYNDPDMACHFRQRPPKFISELPGRESIMQFLLQATEWKEQQASIRCEAVDELFDFQSNGLAFAKDCKELKGTVMGILDLLKSIKGLPKSKCKNSIKLLADAWLTFKYSIKTTESDIREIANIPKSSNIKRYLSHQYCYGTAGTSGRIFYDGEEVGSASYRFEICAQPKQSKVAQFFGLASQTDLLPSVENLWDFVPYSFCVDWFTNLGDALHAIELEDYLKSFDLTYTCETTKYSAALPYQYHPGLIGEVYITSYRRKYAKSIPSLLIAPESRNPIGFWKEGLSLIVQRLK